MLKRILLAVVILGVSATGAFAQTVVFDNLNGGTIDNVISSDVAATIGGETSDDVIFAATTAVTGINWRGAYLPSVLGGDGVFGQPDNFEIRIYDDNAGLPGALNQSFAVGDLVGRTASATLPIGVGGADVDTFEYAADINFTFNAGSTYWLSVVADSAGELDEFSQLVIASGGNAVGDLNPQGALGDSTRFRDQGVVTDFQLTTTDSVGVPEPSSAALLALGLVGFVARRRR